MLGFTSCHFLKYFHCKNLVMVCLQMVLLKCFLNKQVSAFFFPRTICKRCRGIPVLSWSSNKTFRSWWQTHCRNVSFDFPEFLECAVYFSAIPNAPPSAALSFKHLIYLFIYLLVIFMQAGPVQLQVEWGHAWDVPSKTKCIQKYKIQKEPTMQITIYT